MQDIKLCLCIFKVTMHILEWQDIFWSGNIYFGVAIHISEWQNIFRSANAYFGVPMHILE